MKRKVISLMIIGVMLTSILTCTTKAKKENYTMNPGNEQTLWSGKKNLKYIYHRWILFRR